MTKWKTIKIRQADYDLLAQLQLELRDTGIKDLPPLMREILADGITAGTVVGAAVALLRDRVGPNGHGRRRAKEGGRP